MLRCCRSRLGGRDLSCLSADDVVQEVCLAAVHGLPNYQDDGGSFLYLVHAIASNKVAGAYRLISRDRPDAVAELPARPLPGNEPDQRGTNEPTGRHASTAAAGELITLRLIVGLSADENRRSSRDLRRQCAEHPSPRSPSCAPWSRATVNSPHRKGRGDRDGDYHRPDTPDHD